MNFFSDPGSTSWFVLTLTWIVLSWIGARKLAGLDMNTFLKFTWLIAIFCIPFIGPATFFIMQRKSSVVEIEES